MPRRRITGASDGATVNDTRDVRSGTYDLNVTLRAERDVNGSGRACTLTYSAADPSGNSTLTGVVVEVMPEASGYMVESANGYLGVYGTLTAAKPRETAPPDPCQ